MEFSDDAEHACVEKEESTFRSITLYFSLRLLCLFHFIVFPLVIALAMASMMHDEDIDDSDL